MASSTISRGRPRSRSVTRSPTPRSYQSRSPSAHRRSPQPGYRSPTPRRNGRHDSRSLSPSRSPSRSRSYSRDRDSRPRSRTRSETPAPRSTKIVVERLTKNVNEDHLYEIFGQYGEIRDLDLPMNRTFGTNRGTAYILYDHEADAEGAIAHMHEAQLDGAVINVSIVLPRRKLSPPPPQARRGANFDPRNPAPGLRPSGPGQPFGGPPSRSRRASPPASGRSRYPPGSDTYRPRSVSRSRSRSPLPPGGGSRRYQSRSPSYRSRSRSRTPPTRGRGGRGGGRRPSDRDDRRRSPSRGSYDSYDRRSRSRTREWSRR
ncbi:RNA-binding domain-containing protein [Coniochaeta ligniaria NRRL 30616]|uniref:RNA-binding domain-containing protein n=1 Tax=Coniochaeta ligniaria NRRL 30616 TaxID=1408157 RepID=A0A1J7JPJ6_9PEZI|nr:RNA-binding domain-containing protein [Coniochaeta ligniaria NRRL 30616]